MKYTEHDIVRYTLADQAFREAQSLAEHLIAENLDPESHLFSASAAGIVIPYCRPFMSANGLGSLPGEYSQFPTDDLKAIHELMMETRNKVTAHIDVIHGADLHSRGALQNHPGEVLVHLTEKGAIFESTATYLHPNRLDDVVTLCRFQSKRLDSVLGGIGADLLKKSGKLCTLVYRIH